jgi:predicted HicB family RNase H-like nuclease
MKKRLQVRFDAELHAAITRQARVEGTTKAALVRRLLTEAVDEQQARTQRQR